MKYKFTYYEQKYYTHQAILEEPLPEPKMLVDDAIPDASPKIKIVPFNKSIGKYKTVEISYLSVIWYRTVYGLNWKDKILKELRLSNQI